MTALYVTSLTEGAGKTAVCVGLAKQLLSNGKKVGFLKPIIAQDVKSGDSGALFMKQVLNLDEPVDNICPVISGQNNMASMVRKACDRVSSDKDLVSVEGICERSIVDALNAKVIIVEDYSKWPEAKSAVAYKDLEGYLVGVVLNKVPLGRLEKGYDEFSSQFNEVGVTMLGALPEDRLLFTLSVGELAEHLQGEILNNMDKSEELVENFMLGAMTVDPGPEYFSRKVNKAVVVKGDRADMQMAALETAVRCLILSGDIAPIPAVRHRAKDKSVPIIVVKSDTTTTVMAIEETLDRVKLNQVKKLPKLTEIMEKRLNFQNLYQELGLAS